MRFLFLLAICQRLCYTTLARRVGISVLLQLPKLARRVRLPYPAPNKRAVRQDGPFVWRLLFAGVEPEGAWRHAGGMSQPEVASAAAEVDSRTLLHVVASSISLATTFYAMHQKPSRAHSAAPPFKSKPWGRLRFGGQSAIRQDGFFFWKQPNAGVEPEGTWQGAFCG